MYSSICNRRFAASIILLLTFAAAALPLSADPTEDAQTILKKLAEADGAIHTARLTVIAERQLRRFTPEEIARLNMDANQQSETFRDSEEGVHFDSHRNEIVFDNDKSLLQAWSYFRPVSESEMKVLGAAAPNRPLADIYKWDKDELVSRALFQKKACVSFFSAHGPNGTKFVEVHSPIWPPEGPLDLWRMPDAGNIVRGITHHFLTPHLLEDNAITGEAVILLDPGARSNYHQKIWVATHDHYAITRTQMIDKGGFVQIDSTTTYQMQPNGIYYPHIVTDSYFYEDKQHQPIEYEHDTATLQKVVFNTPLSEKDLLFDLPKGARVNDFRFKPPLAYNQGDKQLTDQELFLGSKDPHFLRKYEMGDPPARPSYVLITLGSLTLLLSLVVFGAVKWRRSGAKPPVPTHD